ncbi:UNKNOWN [Stylonychia lemnae]|uniref:Uncharacterized protein n=1 Tax=Stylonychia lemnae TaxID=5949 RepID=A0A078AT87_STYLE|nr:UNKNOWN [Stylonychia lemnae]|eukprot:CDW84377.1 UNKNOWN [Stylonychia lemnae]
MTLIGGIFFMSDEVQSNDKLQFFIFLMIVSYNGTFLVYWIFTLITSIIRYHAHIINRFQRKKSIRPKIDDYETNLKKYITQSSRQMTLLSPFKSDQMKCCNKNKGQFDSKRTPQTPFENISSLLISSNDRINSPFPIELSKKINICQTFCQVE